jgi:hypothetical protein
MKLDNTLSPRSVISELWLTVVGFSGLSTVFWQWGVALGRYWGWWSWNPPWTTLAAVISLVVSALAIILSELTYNGWVPIRVEQIQKKKNIK